VAAIDQALGQIEDAALNAADVQAWKDLQDMHREILEQLFDGVAHGGKCLQPPGRLAVRKTAAERLPQVRKRRAVNVAAFGQRGQVAPGFDGAPDAGL
jgi:hypothetical protein